MEHSPIIDTSQGEEGSNDQIALLDEHVHHYSFFISLEPFLKRMLRVRGRTVLEGGLKVLRVE